MPCNIINVDNFSKDIKGDGLTHQILMSKEKTHHV